MKFKSHKKGYISSYFGEYPEYRSFPHTGIDWNLGYGKPIRTDNAGYVYKIFYDGTDGWRGVYILCPFRDGYMEVVIGHLKDIYVSEGDEVEEDQIIGTEGNFGTVFSGGVKITPEMRESGDKRGSHIHESYRPVRPTESQTEGHYLRDTSGYLAEYEGNYLAIVNDNNTKGCVDPMEWDVKTRLTLRLRLAQLIIKIKKLMKKEL